MFTPLLNAVELCSDESLRDELTLGIRGFQLFPSWIDSHMWIIVWGHYANGRDLLFRDT